ncbi:MAG: heme o synthase [Chitinophagales bacterium]|nr:heme o synthase [Bacteroidota bacterium]MCB9044358.1 protoheme IX farnesyltransferase [Chitinophagales bacterium]
MFQKIIPYNALHLLGDKIKDYAQLVKLRLSLTVVSSAVFAFVLASPAIAFLPMLYLVIAGFLVTASANIINQILEKDYDKLMKRTALRPLAAQRMQVPEAILLAGICGVAGVVLLWLWFNTTAALIGSLSLFLYAFVYTPLKRISPIAVFWGAIPGALPPVIGWVAAANALTYETLLLFAIQFLWQFPHFWAIGWIGYNDYKKAGYKLLPTSYDGRNKITATQIIIYIWALLVVSLIPYFIGFMGIIALVAAVLLGIMFLHYGIKLYRECSDGAALKLMFASIIYLPVLQLSMIVDKVLG